MLFESLPANHANPEPLLSSAIHFFHSSRGLVVFRLAPIPESLSADYGKCVPVCDPLTAIIIPFAHVALRITGC